MRKLRIAIRMALFLISVMIYRASGKVERRKAFFISDVSNELTANMKCVYDEIKRRGYECEIFCKRKQDRPFTVEDIMAVSKGLVSSGYIFLEDVLDFLEFYEPQKDQEIVQLWHGAGAFKMFGFSRPDGAAGQVRVSKGHRKYTKAIVSSENIKWCYADAFGIDESRVVATGVPRTDSFFDQKRAEAAREKFYKALPEARGRKVVLFAPTYRGSTVRAAGYDISRLDLEKLRMQLGEEYVVIFKWHPAAYSNMLSGKCPSYDLTGFDGYYADMSDTADINELLFVTDVLVTDYSSVIFDYSLLNKPIVYYVWDIDEYEGSRGLYYPFEKYIYGECAVTQEELAAAIRKGSMMEDRRQKFHDTFMGACDGHSTAKVCDCISQADMIK